MLEKTVAGEESDEKIMTGENNWQSSFNFRALLPLWSCEILWQWMWTYWFNGMLIQPKWRSMDLFLRRMCADSAVRRLHFGFCRLFPQIQSGAWLFPVKLANFSVPTFSVCLRYSGTACGLLWCCTYRLTVMWTSCGERNRETQGNTLARSRRCLWTETLILFHPYVAILSETDCQTPLPVSLPARGRG